MAKTKNMFHPYQRSTHSNNKKKLLTLHRKLLSKSRTIIYTHISCKRSRYY